METEAENEYLKGWKRDFYGEYSKSINGIWWRCRQEDDGSWGMFYRNDRWTIVTRPRLKDVKILCHKTSELWGQDK